MYVWVGSGRVGRAPLRVRKPGRRRPRPAAYIHMLRALPRAAAGIAASLALQQTCQQSEDRLARWRNRWAGDTRGWELGKTVHPRLAEFEDRLLPEPSRVLVPLAGQSHDVAHLAWRGHNVVAVEGVPAALDAFNEECARLDELVKQASDEKNLRLNEYQTLTEGFNGINALEKRLAPYWQNVERARKEAHK